MRCEDCGHDELYGKIVIEKMIPLNQKGGGLNMKGQKVKQSDVEDAWKLDRMRNEKEVYGPIVCGECGAHHVYVPGLVPALRRGKYEEVMEMGGRALFEGDGGEEE